MKTLLALTLVFSATLILSVAEAGDQKGTGKATTKPATTDEQRLLAAIPELGWSQDRFVTEGWVKPGQVIQPKANGFFKKDVPRFGVTGELGFLFENKRLFDCSFYIDDSEVGTQVGDADWARLYKAVKMICTGPETRSGDGQSSKINWKIAGAATEYDISLTRRVFGTTIERGLEISIKPKKGQ